MKRPGCSSGRALPAAELEPAGDPALAREAPADAPALVVEAAAVAVDEAARRVGDELAERRHPVLQRHLGVSVTSRCGSGSPGAHDDPAAAGL